MGLLVNLQLVPDRILKAVKDRILANRAKYLASQQVVDGNRALRPRIQRQRFAASSISYRRPEPSGVRADEGDIGVLYCLDEYTVPLQTVVLSDIGRWNQEEQVHGGETRRVSFMTPTDPKRISVTTESPAPSMPGPNFSATNTQTYDLVTNLYFDTITATEGNRSTVHTPPRFSRAGIRFLLPVDGERFIIVDDYRTCTCALLSTITAVTASGSMLDGRTHYFFDTLIALGPNPESDLGFYGYKGTPHENGVMNTSVYQSMTASVTEQHERRIFIANNKKIREIETRPYALGEILDLLNPEAETFTYDQIATPQTGGKPDGKRLPLVYVLLRDYNLGFSPHRAWEKESYFTPEIYAKLNEIYSFTQNAAPDLETLRWMMDDKAGDWFKRAEPWVIEGDPKTVNVKPKIINHAEWPVPGEDPAEATPSSPTEPPIRPNRRNSLNVQLKQPSAPTFLPEKSTRDFYNFTILRSWDWGKPEYCKQMLLDLGFTAADLKL